MLTIKEYKRLAKDALRGNWSTAVGTSAVFLLIAGALSASSGLIESGGVEPSHISSTLMYVAGFTMIVSLFVSINLEVGFYNTFRVFYEERDTNMIHNMFSLGFKNYFHNLGGLLLMTIIVFLGMMLFFIPGIILSFAYAMVPYILVEEPELGIQEALRKSREMMKGHKWHFFVLQLSFIGWALLSILTLGIGLLWLMPYMMTTYSAYYKDLKEEYAGTGDFH